VPNYLYFIKDELDTTNPLYIIIKCKDCLIGKVLIDNVSTLNVLPKHMLKEIPSTMTVRAYDGSPI
jgi:hypothetical protein